MESNEQDRHMQILWSLQADGGNMSQLRGEGRLIKRCMTCKVIYGSIPSGTNETKFSDGYCEKCGLEVLIQAGLASTGEKIKYRLVKIKPLLPSDFLVWIGFFGSVYFAAHFLWWLSRGFSIAQ